MNSQLCPPEGAASMRLQKFLARSGVASRRASEQLVEGGHVRVNGQVVTAMGVKVDPFCDVVEVDGVVAHLPQTRAVVMLNKPLGYVTTMKDDHAKKIVADLVPTECYPGLFPLGRLDRDTTGLLLFSTDGELGHALLRPRGHVTKRYVALVEGVLSKGQVKALREGIMLDDGPTLPAEVDVLSGKEAACVRANLTLSAAQAKRLPRERARGMRAGDAHRGDCSVVRVGIHEGRNRQVRRMLAYVGHPVVALHRESFGPLLLGDLACGQWRPLDASEIALLEAAVAGQ